MQLSRLSCIEIYMSILLSSSCLYAVDSLCQKNFAPALFKLGVENISPSLIDHLSSQRIGLITNQTGRDQAGRQTVDILHHHGIKVSMLLVPEHGYHGKVEASDEIKDSFDRKTALPIISLYGNGTGKQLCDRILKNIDTFIFDIQDAGMRHYTYISTLFYALDACARHKKSLVIFDRPNPLGPTVEGPLVDPSLKSFIAIAPIPLRHGMTVGELAHYFNNSCFDKKVSVQVVPLLGYTHKQQQLQGCVMQLSPNIQTLDACYGYSFLGLLGEIRPFDVGIGTSWAFQCITLPKELKVPQRFWSQLRTALKKQSINSSYFTYYSSRKKKQMIGLRIQVHNIDAVSTCSLLAAIVFLARKESIQLTFSPSFDRAIGTTQARSSLKDPTSWTQFMKKISAQVNLFCKNAQSAYLYKPIRI